jgi:hypothetical protein
MTLRNGLTDAWRLDSFQRLSNKEFTYDNGRIGATSAISRINKFMVSQTLEERGGRIEATASVRKLSDHSPLIITIWGQHNCRNPSFGLTTKAKGLQRCGPRGSPGVTSHTPGSVGKCEGVNPHTPKATPTLGDGVPVDSRNFRERFEGLKLNGL